VNHLQDMASIEAEERAIAEEQKLLDEEGSILAEQESLSQLEAQIKSEVPDNALTEEIPLEQANVTPDDISQLQDVTQREINQMEGRAQPLAGSQPEGFVDNMMAVSEGIQQATSAILNPFREMVGMERRQPGTYINPITQWQANETARRIDLSKKGIGSGDTSLGSRFIESLAMDDRNRVKSIKKSLDEKFKGQDVEMWVDQDTGDLIYMNPDDNKAYTANPLGFELGDIVSLTGDAITATVEAGFTAYGAVSANITKAKNKLTKSQYDRTRVRREVGYGAAGAAIGDAIKISLGKVFDINDEVTIGEIAMDAAKEASLSLGFGVGFEGVKSVIKKIRAVRGEAAIPGQLLDNLKDNFDQISAKDFSNDGAGKIVDLVNETLRGAQSDNVLSPNMGQLLNDSTTLDMVESLKMGGTKEKAMLEARKVSNESANQEYFTLIGNEVTDTQAIGKDQLGQNIQAVSQQSVDLQKQIAQAPTDEAAQQSKTLIDDLSASSSYQAGDIVRGSLYKEEVKLKEVFKNEYALIEAKAESQGLIPSTETMKLELFALDDVESGAKVRRITDEFKDGELEFDKEWSLTKLNNTIKSFNALKREAETGKSSARTGKVKKAIKILHNAQQDALKNNPDLLMKLNALSSSYEVGQEIFNDSVVNSIIKNKDKLPTSDIFNAVIKNSDTAESTAAAIMDDPWAMQAMRRGINDLYIYKVSQDGIIDYGKHKQFVRDYIETRIVTKFFNGQQLKNLDQAGSISRIYKIEKQRSDNLLKEINKTFDSKISNMDGKTLFNKVWGEEKASSIIKLKSLLSSEPEIWRSVQAEMLNSIKNTVMSGDSLSVSNLDTLLIKNIRTIEEGLGVGYANNLKTLKESLTIANRQGEKFNLDKESGVAKIALTIMGRLHPRAKNVTTADQARAVYARKLLTEMILDPEKMRKLSALKRARGNSDTYKLIVTRLGFKILAQDDDDGQGFQSSLREVGYKTGLLYRRQQQANAVRDKALDEKRTKEKQVKLKKLKQRQKSLSL